MGKKPNTKSARRRANERRRKVDAEHFEKTFGPLPDHILEAAKTFGTNTDITLDQDNWERAPAHVVEWDECPAVDKGKIAELSQAAALERARVRTERIGDMKALCPDIWGQRGAAHKVAKRWREDCGEVVSVRTIQQYFRETRD